MWDKIFNIYAVIKDYKVVITHHTGQGLIGNHTLNFTNNAIITRNTHTSKGCFWQYWHLEMVRLPWCCTTQTSCPSFSIGCVHFYRFAEPKLCHCIGIGNEKIILVTSIYWTLKWRSIKCSFQCALNYGFHP